VTAVDTSALMAIVLDEPTAGACEAALATEDDIVISAVTLAEALIVSARRGHGADGSADRWARLRDHFRHAGRGAADRRGLLALGERHAPGRAELRRLLRLRARERTCLPPALHRRRFRETDIEGIL
jgi:predicted nucleic acid-binding protein